MGYLLALAGLINGKRWVFPEGETLWSLPWEGLLPAALLLLFPLVVGGWVARLGYQYRGASQQSPGYWELVALGSICIMGAVFRLYSLDNYPACLDLDTAENGVIAHTLVEELAEGKYTPVLRRWAAGNETAFLYLQGFFLKVFGNSVTVLRLPSALTGILTLPVVYLLGRRLGAAHLGLLSAFLVAVSPWHIDMSRSAKRPVMTPLFVALGMYLLLRLLRDPPPRGEAGQTFRFSWLTMRGFVMCGLVVGLGLHGYEAFRLFPLAVAAIIVWVRFRQGEPLRGVGELAVVGASAALVTLPIILFAFKDFQSYMGHVTGAAVSSSAREVLENFQMMLNFFLFNAHFTPFQGNQSTVSLQLLTPLFLAGLMGLLLHRGKPPHQGEHRTGRAILLLTLLIMGLIMVLSRVNFTGRRFSGILIPFYVLAAAGALGLVRGLALSLGTRLSGAAAGLWGLALVGTFPSTLAGMSHHIEGYSQTRRSQILRWSHARAEEGHEVYLSTSIQDNHYLTQFFTQHPRMQRLPLALPLPQGPLQKKVLLVADGEAWQEPVARLFGGRLQRVKMPMPRLPHWSLKLWKENLEFQSYIIDPARIRSRRPLPRAYQGGFNGYLVAPFAGLYSFRPLPGARLRVKVNDTALLLDPGPGPKDVALAAGLHRLQYERLAGKGGIQWKIPGVEDFRPLPPGLVWQLPADVLPQAPAVARFPLAAGSFQTQRLPTERADQGEVRFQDIAPAPRGKARTPREYLVLHFFPGLVSRWSEGGASPLGPYLRGPGGEAFKPEHAGLQLHEGLPQYHLAAYRLAVSPGGIFILSRNDAAALRFSPEGVYQHHLPPGLIRPLDIAASGGKVYVADMGRRAVVVMDVSGKVMGGPWTQLIRGVLPTSVAATGGRLAYLDRRTHRLVLFNLASRTVAWQASVGTVTEESSVSVGPSAQVVVANPVRSQVLMFSREGQILAGNGDPNFYYSLAHTSAPHAVHLDDERLAVIDRHEGWVMQYTGQ